MGLSKRSVRKIVRELEVAKAKAKQFYGKADELTDKLIAGVKPGVKIDLGNGSAAEVVDNFADKNKVWKAAGVNRFDVKITTAA